MKQRCSEQLRHPDKRALDAGESYSAPIAIEKVSDYVSIFPHSHTHTHKCTCTHTHATHTHTHTETSSSQKRGREEKAIHQRSETENHPTSKAVYGGTVHNIEHSMLVEKNKKQNKNHTLLILVEEPGSSEETSSSVPEAVLEEATERCWEQEGATAEARKAQWC